MQTSITIGGLEVGLATKPGALENLVAERYAPYLGAAEAPVCWLQLAPLEGRQAPDEEPTVEWVGENFWNVVEDGFRGQLNLSGLSVLNVKLSASAIDKLLRMTYALLAPKHHALLVHGTSKITRDLAHVFIGTPRPARVAPGWPADDHETDSCVLLYHTLSGVWVSAGTPFQISRLRRSAPRESRLVHLWSLGEVTLASQTRANPAEAMSALMSNAILPGKDLELHRIALGLATDLAGSVPLSTAPYPPWHNAGWEADPTPCAPLPMTAAPPPS